MKGGFESLFKALHDAVATNKKRKATQEPEARPVPRGGGQVARREDMDIDYDSEETSPIGPVEGVDE